jgi:glycosyltransferase involved in cell wall biosynthesis
MLDTTLAKSPTISVVVASAAGGEFLFRCLDSLREQTLAEKADVIVVDRCGGNTATRIAKEYPFVTLIVTDPARRVSVPELRLLGAQQARGEIVAIIEEHCVAPPEWLKTIRSSFVDGCVAIGGPILDSNFDRVQDWVVYFSEYHNYLPPWSTGERFLLNGANIAYPRQILLEYGNILTSGYWEVVLHPSLSQRGQFRAIPKMGVYHTGPFDYGYYLSQRYFLSRVWGGTQRDKVGVLKRLTYLIGAPIFPMLLLMRITHRVLNNGQLIKQYLWALPLLVPVAGAYVWGEWLGYLRGMGNALERVE